MRYILINIIFLTLIYAKPAILGGISLSFGGDNKDILKNAGATVKIVSNSQKKKPVVAAGISYYPWAEDNKMGLDVSAGYTLKNSAILGGWDFLQKHPTVSIGYNKSVDSGSDVNSGIQDARCHK